MICKLLKSQVDVAEWSVDVNMYYVDNLPPDIPSNVRLNSCDDRKKTLFRYPVNQIQLIGQARFEVSLTEKELQ